MKNHQLVTAIMVFAANHPEQTITSIDFEDGSGNNFNIETTEYKYFVSIKDGVINKMVINDGTRPFKV